VSNTLVLSIDEVFLKGRNRPIYIKMLMDHVSNVLKAHHGPDFTLGKVDQRFVVETTTTFSRQLIDEVLTVPGLHSVAPARKVSYEIETIKKALCEEMMKIETPFKTFKVRTKRSDKNFPIDSMVFSALAGGWILELDKGWKVDVHRPDIFIDIRVTSRGVYLSNLSYKGMGGLPLGLSGHLVCLLSGGFDSPVASYLMSKRGCDQSFIFFYAYPFVGEGVRDKVIELTKALSRYQRRSPLYIIPFGGIQETIVKKCREEYRTLLFRHYMVQCASLLANRIGAIGLITGDSLGQVSSQTIPNMALVEHATTLPVFRPLVGFNKREIIDLARKIGTHDISVRPHDDACTLFGSRNPVTKPDVIYWKRFVVEVDLAEELAKALDEAEVVTFDLSGNMSVTDMKGDI
jgi:thiamine biosynthesis protein ThiI